MFERVLFFCGPHLSLFEFQISKYVYVRYVARPCTLFPAVIAVFVVAVVCFLCGCTEKAMPVRRTGDAAAALLGMHRSRHGGERRWWRRIELVIRSRRY